MQNTKPPENSHADGSKAFGEQSPLRLISWPQLQKILAGRSYSSVRRDELAGRFPRRVKRGPRQIAWFAHEIESWLQNLKNSTADHPNESDGE